MTPAQEALQVILDQKHDPHFLIPPSAEIPVEEGTAQKAVERKLPVSNAIAAPIVSSEESKVHTFFPELQKAAAPIVEEKKKDSAPKPLTSKQWESLIRWNS